MSLIALRFNYIFIIINCYRYYFNNNISHSINDSINDSFKDSLSCLPTKILTLIVFETNFHSSLMRQTVIAMYAKFLHHVQISAVTAIGGLLNLFFLITTICMCIKKNIYFVFIVDISSLKNRYRKKSIAFYR
jgi:hypothetical protein